MTLQANRTLRQRPQKSGRRRSSELGHSMNNTLSKEPTPNKLEALQKDLQKAEMLGKILFFGGLTLFGVIVLIWIGLSFWIFSKL